MLGSESHLIIKHSLLNLSLNPILSGPENATASFELNTRSSF